MIGVLASVVGAFYYLRIVKVMYFDEPDGGFEPMAGRAEAVLACRGVVMLFFFLIARPDRRRGGAAAKSLF